MNSNGKKKTSKIIDFLLSDDVWSRKHFIPRKEEVKEVGYPENLKIAAGLEEEAIFQIPTPAVRPRVKPEKVEEEVETIEPVEEVAVQNQPEVVSETGAILETTTVALEEPAVEEPAEPGEAVEKVGIEPEARPETVEAISAEVEAVPTVSIGEVEYAILKSIIYGYKTVKEISKTLQIKPIIIEKRINELIKDGYVKYFQHAVVTTRGHEQIELFETVKSRDTWVPIDDFIKSVSEKRKERSQKIHRIIDLALLVSIIILIILLIYFNVLS